MALFGGTGMIKGGHTCVCFSEAPLSAIKNGLVNESFYSRYSPFGIMVSKKWFFKQGGRPVIYQTEEEYSQLTENKWRHVTYNPSLENPIDFTWEREWRINAEKLELNENMSTIVLPNKEWAYHLIDHFEWYDHALDRQQYSLIFDDPIMIDLMASPRGFYFGWPIITLDNS